jgi:hypothetical protein
LDVQMCSESAEVVATVRVGMTSLQ